MINQDILIIVIGGFAGGLFNTAFTGGGLIAFLALVYVGVPPLTANAVNLLAMPTSFATVLPQVRLRRSDVALLAAAATGTVAGALLATRVQADRFAGLAPWLVLAAAMLLVAQPLLTKQLSRSRNEQAEGPLAPTWVTAALLCLTGGYAGFFGAGVGTFVLIVMAFTSGLPLKAANRAKNVVCLATSIVGCLVFLTTGLITPGVIDWEVAGWLALGMTAGGAAGTWLAPRTSELVTRLAIVSVSVAGTLRLPTMM